MQLKFIKVRRVMKRNKKETTKSVTISFKKVRLLRELSEKFEIKVKHGQNKAGKESRKAVPNQEDKVAENKPKPQLPRIIGLYTRD